MTDAVLLEDVVKTRSQAAFATLVDRYVGLVYGIALRQVGDRALAEDVVQGVFWTVWERAQRIRNGAALAGWLVNATRLAAKAAARGERRRKKREAVAAAMTAGTAASPDESTARNEIALVLEKALAELGDMDRTVVSLRYLQDKSVAEIAATIGISEKAATKRIYRAMERLRSGFAQQGYSLQVPALVESLSGLRVKPPEGLAPATVSKATAKTHASTAMVAKAAIVAMQIKQVAAVAIPLVLVLFVSGAAAWWAAVGNGSSKASGVHVGAAGAPIKVGMIFSYRTGTESSWMGSPYGFDVQTQMLPALQQPDIEVFPIVETGTDSKAPMPVQLRKYFHTSAAIDGGDATALEKLDVIVSCGTWRTTDSLVNAVREAVQHGVGLVNGAGMGTEGPEYAPDHPAVAQIAGLIEGQYGWNPGPVPGVVLTNHPLLGSLKAGDAISIAPNGAYGILAPGAIPLIGLKKPSDARPAGNTIVNDSRYVFYPLYVSSLGKGRIVGCQFAIYEPVPMKLQRATHYRFYANCVRWAAGRPLE